MAKKKNISVDYDSQWKEIITSLFQDFIEFFLPQAEQLIDFDEPIVFLEQELFKIIADKDKKGKVINDKLVKVNLKNGVQKWILIHIEIQSSFESDFSERMFTYFYRIFDRYGEKITAIAIYTGEKISKKENRFEYEFLGTKATYQFNSYKIINPTKEELLKSKNPFALVVLASQYLLESKDDFEKRYSFKRTLIQLAKEKQFKDIQIISLLRFIDLILQLPEELEMKFEQEIINSYIKSESMVARKSEKFANQLHIALYGESLEEKRKKEKILIAKNLLMLEKLTIGQIALVINESEEFVEKIKQNMT